MRFHFGNWLLCAISPQTKTAMTSKRSHTGSPPTVGSVKGSYGGWPSREFSVGVSDPFLPSVSVYVHVCIV